MGRCRSSPCASSWYVGRREDFSIAVADSSLQNYCFYTAVIVAALEIVSLVLFGLQLRKAKREGGYSRITAEKR